MHTKIMKAELVVDHRTTIVVMTIITIVITIVTMTVTIIVTKTITIILAMTIIIMIVTQILLVLMDKDHRLLPLIVYPRILLGMFYPLPIALYPEVTF
ncbi:MAG: hypothetical protein CMF51_04875 [Legionellales bacterium]|nr:hypothetical protein [Legionellales bacterium]